jgi:acetyltransferase-like isoleucine patch superfamily enzyme
VGLHTSVTATFVEPFSIGVGSYVGGHTHIAQYTYIGSYCSIANLCTIGARPHDLKRLTTYPFAVINGHETVIGHDVWIGSNSVVLAGLNIGTGSVIGAGSVVTKNVPPYSIVVGNPARVLKYRFPKDLIDKFLKSKWWELPEEKIRSLPLDDPRECIKKVEALRGLF